MESKELVSFQHLWSVTSGRSGNKEDAVIKDAITKLKKELVKGLDYFKSYTQSSADKVKDDKNISELFSKFSARCGKLLNLDCKQAYQMIQQYTDNYYHGSEDSIQKRIKDERDSRFLLGNIANYYFNERLYLLRCYGPIIYNSQDKTHPLQTTYKDALESLSSVFSLLQDQFEASLKEKAANFSNRGEDCQGDVAIFLAVERVKEQCGMLEIFLLYYSQFTMSPTTLLRFTSKFAECGFGRNHPLLTTTGGGQQHLDNYLVTMNSLQQIIFIEGVDMEFLQETDAANEHQLSKDKMTFDKLDALIASQLSTDPHLSPITLTWATVRYLLLDSNGGEKTMKLGEKSIDLSVWMQVRCMMSSYPFNTDSETSYYGRKAMKMLISCVTNIFHESTLGDYEELISAVTCVMEKQFKRHNVTSDCSSDLLLLSAVGYVPINCSPMLSLLSCMVDSVPSVKQINAFLSSLPSICEYISTCSRDEIEHLEDGNYWRLLSDKTLRCLDGKLNVVIPDGTIGCLVNNHYGGMVQWQVPVNGWKVIHAQIQNVADHYGPSSNLELLGISSTTQLIMKLLQQILVAMETEEAQQDTGCMAMLETIEPLIQTTYLALSRLSHIPDPPVHVIASIIECLTAWMKTNPTRHCCDVITHLLKMNYLPYDELLMEFTGLVETNREINPGSFGRIIVEHERMQGKYALTTSTIQLISTALQLITQHDVIDSDVIVTKLKTSVEYVMTEVFTSFVEWLRTDVQSWNNIGHSCLELCHVILNGRNEMAKMRQILIEILTQTQAADVLLKLSSIPATFLLNLLSNEPFSARTEKANKTVVLTFSLLNNLLRCDDVTKKDSHLRDLLSHPPGGSIPSDDNLVYILHGYLYHRQSSNLPRLAITLLRRISVISPMSLYSVLGAEAKAFRDILSRRLQEETEDDSLKISILELLVVSVQTQPALFELSLDLQPVKDSSMGTHQLGERSCLGVVLKILDRDNLQKMELNVQLHTVCVKLLNALWADRRFSAIKALQNRSSDKFWSSLLFPLFSENSPRNVALHQHLETSAHVINIIALERYYKIRPNTKDEPLCELLKQFQKQNRFKHWSKVLLCVCKSMCQQIASQSSTTSPPTSDASGDYERHLMFASAWKSFVVTSSSMKSEGGSDDVSLMSDDDVTAIIDDLLTAIDFLFDNTYQEKKEVVTLLNLVTSLLLVLVNKNAKKKKKNYKENSLESVIKCLEKTRNHGQQLPQYRNNLFAVAFQLFTTSDKMASETCNDLICVTCVLLHDVFKMYIAPYPPLAVEACMLAIQLLEKIYLKCAEEESTRNNEIQQYWLAHTSRESVINLLLMVELRLIKNKINQFEDENAKLCITIAWFLARVSPDSNVAMAIRRSRHLSDIFLNLPRCYKNEGKFTNKWCEVYHVTLIMMSHMIECLRHELANEAIAFVGIHQARFLECMTALDLGRNSLATSRGSLREVIHTTELLQLTMKNYPRQLRFELGKFYDAALNQILLASHASVAFLLHPSTLKEYVQNNNITSSNSRKDIVTSQQQMTQRQRKTSHGAVQKRISCSETDDNLPPEVLTAQRGLVNVLSNCLSFLYELSPEIGEILLDRTIDVDAYPRFLAMSFATPNFTDDGFPTFATLMNAASFAYSVSRKMKTSKDHVYRDMLKYAADLSLTITMSQTLLYLKSSSVPLRVKQILKRELGDEMTSCAKTELRLQRYYSNTASSSQSPSTSPNTSLNSSTIIRSSMTSSAPTTSSRSMPELLQQFVKHLMR